MDAARRERFWDLLQLLAVLVVSVLGAMPSLASAQPADVIFMNGVIRTMEGPDKVVDAVAVRNGRIIEAGSAENLRHSNGRATQIVDLDGRTMLPGFIDAHGHISASASFGEQANLSPPPVAGVTDLASLQATLRTYIANQEAPGAWVRGYGYDDAELSEHRHPTRQELDAVSHDRPIFLFHVSGHLAVANTLALEEAGLLRDAPDLPGGVIHKEADGRTASGLLEEAAVFKVMGLIAEPSLEERIALLRKAQAQYAGYGITTAQDGAISPADWAVLQEAARRKDLFIDVGALLYYRAQWPGLDRMPIGETYRNRLRILGVKLMLDGSPGGRTAWLKQPYHVPPEGKERDYRGYGQLSDTDLRGWLTRAADQRWQLFVHVNGDAAMQQLIDSVAAVDAARPRALERTIAIHSQVVGPDQLKQMKTLDIQPTFFVTHTFYWGDWHREVTLGPVRADRISPVREAIDLGLTVTTHNDAPVVPPDMLRLLWSSVTRQTRSNDILGPTERISPYEALLTVTRNAAWQIHEEATKGTIAKGKLADFVILDSDPLTVPKEALDRIKVIATFKEGRQVFGAGLGSPASD